MAIAHYVGTEGVTVLIEEPEDLHEALDILHTQIMDAFGDDSPMLRVLETAMKTLEDELNISSF